MIEIKGNKLKIDGKVMDLDEVNIIHQVKNNLHLSNSIVEFAQNLDIKELFEKLKEKGFHNFILVNKALVNINNVDSLKIKYYQYAGISIYECEKKHAELYVISLECKDGKTESISFRTLAETEKYYQELDAKLTELNNKEASCN